MGRGKYGKQYELDGNWYFLKQLEDMSGIGFQTIKHRIEVQKMSVKEAISLPTKKYVLHMYHGRRYPLGDIAEMAGITQQCLSYHMRKGLTAEQAADLPRHKKGTGRPKKKSDGCVYPDCFHCPLKDCIN